MQADHPVLRNRVGSYLQFLSEIGSEINSVDGIASCSKHLQANLRGNFSQKKKKKPFAEMYNDKNRKYNRRNNKFSEREDISTRKRIEDLRWGANLVKTASLQKSQREQEFFLAT